MLLDATYKRVKICDLGFSKITSPSRENNGRHEFLTDGGRGTEGYTARRKMEKGGDNLTAAVDVFSLGRSVWHMMHRSVFCTHVLPQERAAARVSDERLLFVEKYSLCVLSYLFFQKDAE